MAVVLVLGWAPPASAQPASATAAPTAAEAGAQDGGANGDGVAPGERKPRPVGQVIAEAFTPVGWPAARRRANHVLDARGPVAWPGLSHSRYAFNFELLVASTGPIDPSSGVPLDDRAFAYAGRWFMELPLLDRVWYAGVVHDVAAASVPSGSAGSGGSTLVLGNPELWLRGLWTSELGLSAGGGLGLVVPVPRTFSALESEVVRAVRVVRADQYAHFRDMTVTFRPYLDVRHVVGPVVLQARQGLDVGLVARSRRVGESRYDLTAVTMLYAGVTAFDRVTFGLEAQEVYQITVPVSDADCLAPCDARRAQLSLSPSIRIETPRLSPSLSVLFPLSTPLRREVTSFIAGRLNVDVGF